MKSSRSRVARVAAVFALATVVVLPLSACGSQGPGVAAVVDGQTIRESDLDDIAADFAKVQGAQAPQRADMVAMLVARPFVVDAVGGHALTENGVRELLGREVPQPSDATVRYFQANEAQRLLDQATAQQVANRMAAADIEVSPKYGTFEPGRGLTQAPENWIAPPTPAQPTP